VTRGAAGSIALVALVWLVTLAGLDLGGMWITDSENKLLQTRAIVASGGRDFALPWPGRAIDPDPELYPIPPPFARLSGGRFWSQYPPAFALLSAPLLGWLSFPGLHVWPLAGGLLGLAAVARLARAGGAGPRGQAAAVLCAGLLTPLWFYSVVFWEHSLAAGLLLWALDLALERGESAAGRRALAAGALAAAAAALRDEMALLAAPLALLLLLDARPRRLRAAGLCAAAFAAGLALVAAFQWAAVGSPLGHHVQGNLAGPLEHLRSRPAVFYRLFVAAAPGPLLSAALGAPLALLPAAWPRLRAERLPAALSLTSLVAALCGAAWLADSLLFPPGPTHHLLSSNSLVPAAPFLALGLLRFSDADPDAAAGRIRRRLRQCALAYALLYALLAPPAASQGVHWGCRFLLPLYPVLAVLAARNIAAALRRGGAWPLRGALALVLSVSLAAQLQSVRLLADKTEHSRRLGRELLARPEPVLVTDTWWIGPMAFEVLGSRPMFLVRDGRQLDRLRASLRARGIASFTWVTRADRREARPGETIVADGGLRFFAVGICALPTVTPRAAAGAPGAAGR
jgi:hypothetical protein